MTSTHHPPVTRYSPPPFPLNAPPHPAIQREKQPHANPTRTNPTRPNGGTRTTVHDAFFFLLLPIRLLPLLHLVLIRILRVRLQQARTYKFTLLFSNGSVYSGASHKASSSNRNVLAFTCTAYSSRNYNFTELGDRDNSSLTLKKDILSVRSMIF